MSQVTEFRGRGIQEADVYAAADALLAEGKRPTIERVRLHIGRGSPNTVSPMLEKWFATLGDRLVSVHAGAAKAAGNDSEGMPVGVRNAAKLLWETARREAEEVQRAEAASVREQLQVREDALAEAQGVLAQREEAFKQARMSLDAALASSQQARETLERQLKDHAIEAHRVRAGLEDEIKRLTALLSQAAAVQEDMRRAHAEAIAVKDHDLRRAEERHAAQERRMLEDVDRARQAAKHAEAGFAREQQRRLQSEEAAAQTLEAGRQRLRETQQAAQQMERELREQVASQAVDLAKAKSDGESFLERGQDLAARLQEEKAAHEATRQLLTKALDTQTKVSVR
ncbi:DNA-binding protein [Variovorax sp. OV329]|uniref:DNA-binding protein n=1 Tax=Variovorax sp. OV329 TaxID=1882825 RepID=UPI0008E4706C|nr:DNA-binding protein [Variovorax sp. OV329]SFN51956.1 replication region DNA-binding N-term [Variovorax sp. OV329]